MSKITEAQLPSAQQTEMTALILLVLAQLDENTRETVRRQVIHQFEQARIVDRNPDEPSLPTNSPCKNGSGLIDLAETPAGTNPVCI